MTEKEVDIREEVLNKEYREWVDEKGIGAIYPPKFPEAYKGAAINAMDENGKRKCLELLEYMAIEGVMCCMDSDGPYFKVRGEVLTKEQLFENFL